MANGGCLYVYDSLLRIFIANTKKCFKPQYPALFTVPDICAPYLDRTQNKMAVVSGV